MRAVGYLRVSTIRQSDVGRSLEDQQRRVHRWVESRGATLVATYRESESAWSRRGPDGRMRESAEARAEFARMIAEFPITRPRIIVVDTLDRWTRTLREGLNLLEQLRGHGVGLLALDWERDRPIDVDDDQDWGLVVRAFTSAEDENRARSRRSKRAYEGRRARGAPLASRPPFGLKRLGDRYVPDPDTSWIVQKIDERYLAGEHSMDTLRWLNVTHPNAITSRTGLRRLLLASDYVGAGVRSDETAGKIRERAAILTTRHGMRGTPEHEFTGVFACGRCIKAGIDPKDALMGEQTGHPDKNGTPTSYIVCQAQRTVRRRHERFSVRVERIAPAWRAFLKEFEKAGVEEASLRRWARAESSDDGTVKRRQLQRALARLDQDEAALASARRAALALSEDPERVIVAQAKKALLEVAADEAELHARRETIRGELSTLQRPARDVRALREALARYRDVYETVSIAERNMLNRALVAAYGSYPVVDRDGDRRWSPVTVSWPGAHAKPVIDVPERRKRASRTRRKDAVGSTRGHTKSLLPA